MNIINTLRLRAFLAASILLLLASSARADDEAPNEAGKKWVDPVEFYRLKDISNTDFTRSYDQGDIDVNRVLKENGTKILGMRLKPVLGAGDREEADLPASFRGSGTVTYSYHEVDGFRGVPLTDPSFCIYTDEPTDFSCAIEYRMDQNDNNGHSDKQLNAQFNFQGIQIVPDADGGLAFMYALSVTSQGTASHLNYMNQREVSNINETFNKAMGTNPQLAHFIYLSGSDKLLVMMGVDAMVKYNKFMGSKLVRMSESEKKEFERPWARIYFEVEEIQIQGEATPLTEEERKSLIDQMEGLTDWLTGKGDPLGLGEHTGPKETAVIEIIGIIGSILLGNGIVAASGGGASTLGNMLGATNNPTPPPMPSKSPPKLQITNPKKKEEEDEGEAPPEEPKSPYWDKFMSSNPDGTMTMKDPITGKPLTYYPTPDGKWESELGTVYDKAGLEENLRYRAENSEILSLGAAQAAKNAQEQHEAWVAKNQQDAARGYSDSMKEYKDKWAAENAALDKEEKIAKLADKYGVQPTEKAVKDAIKFEQTMAQLDAHNAISEAEDISKTIEVYETVDKTAELVVNVMGETVPGGRVVKNVYTFVKATGVAASESYHQGMSLGDAAKHIGMGAVSGTVGVIQNQAGELSSNIFTEGIMVVGGEAIRSGLDAIGKGENVNDAMLSAAAKKAGYFLTGKVVQAEAKTFFGNTSTPDNPASNVFEKYLGKGNMHADWSNFASTNTINLVEGTASLVQETGATFDGYKALDPVQDPERNPYLPDKYKTVEEFTKAVKQFSNAAEDFRKKR